MDLVQKIIERAKSNKQRIVLPEATEERTLRAADRVLADDVADLILIGNPDEVHKLAKEWGLTNIDKATLIDPENNPKAEEYATLLAELRKKKGMTIEQARELVKNPLYLGCMIIKTEGADGQISGALSTTGDTLRPALQIIKCAPGISCVSGAMLLITDKEQYGEDGILVMGDVAVTPMPDASQLAQIAVCTAQTAKSVAGFAEPRVAMLSFSTKGSASHEVVDKVVEATRLARELDPTLQIDGELQADASLVPSVGAKKAPGSKIAGPLLPYAHIILYVVTAILVLTDSATMFVIPLLLCLLCFASQRFEAIFISLTLLLLRAIPYDLDLLSYCMGQVSTWVYFCGVAVVIYLDVLSLMAFLKTERGKKLVGRANDQAAAANQRQQEYAAARQAQQAYQPPYQAPYQPPVYQETPPVPPMQTPYAAPAQPEYPQSAPSAPVPPVVQQEPETVQETRTAQDNPYTEPEQIPETPAPSYGTFEDPAPGDPPQSEETVPDATVQVPLEEIQQQDSFGGMPQQVSSDIQDMMDQPNRPINPDFIFCTRCGSRMSRSDNVCIKCGARLEK